MSHTLIRLDVKRCIGCKACEVQCQVKNRTPAAIRPALLVTAGLLRQNQTLELSAGFRPCFHCETPWCVAACPVKAMVKRQSDGIVHVIKDLCVGCRACVLACPWKVPQWDEACGKVIKCDGCMDRVDQGQEPACVAGCTTHALSFASANDNVRRVRSAYARALLVGRDVCPCEIQASSSNGNLSPTG